MEPGPAGLRGRHVSSALALVLIGVLALAPWAPAARTATLVKDIHPGSEGSIFASLTNVAGRLYFSTNDDTHGYELWRSSGTAAGTELVRDVNPGTANSAPDWLANITGTLSSRPTMARTATSSGSPTAPRRGRRWSRTSTPARNSSSPFISRRSANKLFFTAGSPGPWQGAWTSDGTAAGTKIVKEFLPRRRGLMTRSTSTDVAGTLYFNAWDGIRGWGLVEVQRHHGGNEGWSRTSAPRRWAGTPKRSRTSPARSTSTPATGPMAASCGDPTAPRRGPSSSGTSGAAPRTPLVPPHGRRRETLLRGQRGAARQGALEVRWHLGGDVPPRGLNPGPASSNPEFLTNVAGALFFTATEPTRPGALENGRHRRRDEAPRNQPWHSELEPQLAHRRRGHALLRGQRRRPRWHEALEFRRHGSRDEARRHEARLTEQPHKRRRQALLSAPVSRSTAANSGRPFPDRAALWLHETPSKPPGCGIRRGVIRPRAS